MKKVLTLSEYTLRYDKRPVLENISLDIFEREVHAMCGMTGSGIEFIANALLRVHPYRFRETGDIVLDGTLLTKLDGEEMRYVRLLDIGLISSEVKDPSEGMLTVGKFLLYPYKEPLKKNKREIYVDSLRIMELMGVKHAERIFGKKLSSLSEKYLRAVLTASALASDPALVVITAFGNTKNCDSELYDLIIKICKIKDIALLILTSDISFAMKYGEKVTVLERGGIAETFEAGKEPQSFQTKFLMDPALSYEKMQFRSDDVLTEYHSTRISRNGKMLETDLHRGEILGLFTRNTKYAVNILSGKRAPSVGSIIKNGDELSKIKPWSRKIFVLDSRLSGMFLPQTEISDLIERFKRLDKTGERPISVNTALDYMDLDLKITSVQIDAIDSFTCARLCLALAAISGADTVIITKPYMLGSPCEQFALMQYIKKLCGTGVSFILVSDRREMVCDVSDTYIEID